MKEKETQPERRSKGRPKGRAVDKKDRILAAWQGGDRDIYQIIRLTGLSYRDVRQYIPISEED